MVKILISWIGATDLKASQDESHVGQGPIAQAVVSDSYDEIVLISDYPKKTYSPYIKWLKTKTNSAISIYCHPLSSPTNFDEIYQAATQTISEKIKARGKEINLTFHLSPGTPAMAAVWIILSKTRFPARLIESSKQQGVRVASVPFDISAEYIPDLIRKADADLTRLAAGLPADAPEFDEIVYRSDSMKRVVLQARKAAIRTVPVLIEGESGTGKELLARAIHKASSRNNKNFVPINCGAIPSELVESELFGYEKGAFTGAAAAKPGHFEMAHEGTLFLDEVGELPKNIQVKLLRVLQEGEVYRVGSTKPRKLDIRIIAATNRNLIDEIVKGSFREDLFYRLAVAVIKLPPLRDRSGDISLLIDTLMDRINRDSETVPGYKHKKISVSARNLLINHNWPGNIRELQNTLTRAAIWSAAVSITDKDIQDAIISIPAANTRNTDILNRPIEAGIDLQEIIRTVAIHYLKRGLEKTNGNKTKTSELLRFSNYQTLTNWLKKYGLE